MKAGLCICQGNSVFDICQLFIKACQLFLPPTSTVKVKEKSHLCVCDGFRQIHTLFTFVNYLLCHFWTTDATKRIISPSFTVDKDDFQATLREWKVHQC